MLFGVAVGCNSKEKASQDGDGGAEVAGRVIPEKLKTTTAARAKTLGCLSCHEGIEAIRESSSAMLAMIKGIGAGQGDPQGCVVCHGGNPKATTIDAAHSGAPDSLRQTGPNAFYRDPGSIWIAHRTCGQASCHPNYVERVKKSLMNTGAGMIQGNLRAWGEKEAMNYQVRWGNYKIEDQDGTKPIVGTSAYKRYMMALISLYPKQFPRRLEALPSPSVEEVEGDPGKAGFVYQRQRCQRCHVGVRGRHTRGDYRGMGCSSCHIVYSNEGLYEGGDPTIAKNEPGHLLRHRIHGTREAGGGIPVETCNSCHNRGKRVGTSYQGVMSFPYGTPFDQDGKQQRPLHQKRYLYISEDLHHQFESRPENPKGGLLCQDCHTSVDVHGDGNIAGTTLAQVEIECEDCHGTPERFPWELPLGYGEEFGRQLSTKPRGLSKKQGLETSQFATEYRALDGFLLSTRGNPLGNVVKDRDKVILHSATGNDFEVPLLKQINHSKKWRSVEGMVSMSQVKAHVDRMECYACHSTWVPQFYGRHARVDFTKDKAGAVPESVDWLASATGPESKDGETAESKLSTSGIKRPGKVTTGYSYLRWEQPILGINGEGRVTPIMASDQLVYSVVGRNGVARTVNRTPEAADTQKALGQRTRPLAMGMSPVQPHSSQRKARTCTSCHSTPKALGYGINGGVFQNRYDQSVIKDVIDQRTGKPLSKQTVVQITPILDLKWDWSTVIDPKTGEQTQTVGGHWPLARGLNKEERDAIDRDGECMGCHREMSNEKLWSQVATKGRLKAQEHIKLMNNLLKNGR
ncbi:MAG: cytochrome C [Deltaproteobacteria bacterium]|nr:cytochrome C [Deltaproteobacteria bacterium]